MPDARLRNDFAFRTQVILVFAVALAGGAMAQPRCSAESGALRTPVIELYTSEGCSSCPPADRWLSTLKDKSLVVQAFHVSYWDYMGWTDRFSSPAFNARHRELAKQQGARFVYTPQIVRDGKDWRDYAGQVPEAGERARVQIALQRVGVSDMYEARVNPLPGVARWSAYWTITEHGHVSKVKAGENNGSYLKHDFVVRQFVPMGTFDGPQLLKLDAVPGQPEHPRQINLVVTNAKTSAPLQALSLQCLAKSS
ncbi:DUF1223 domain-containing protein [Rhodoferax saidenbachensis]|uniref:DUF1223 domain-containing protein n=1 Tax=Rhodoferax saidenbachensis TaxID=1484693 RepID=A0A1P8K915_9BURK|nr:DUF1223 domain-containing protein [Rhodoferax saidenbachensis]APW42487.1 hypothetical protein RS694_08040 [Rhodoferax saidenbachensis]